MKIALFVDSLGPGGAERVMSLLATRWAELGHDVTLHTLYGRDRDFYNLHARVERNVLGHPGPARNVVDGLLLNARRVRAIRRSLKATRPDIAVSFLARMNVVVLAAAATLPIPVVVSERTDPRTNPPDRFVQIARRLLYRRATCVVTQTAAVEDWVLANVPGARTTVIPNPVSPTIRPVERIPRRGTRTVIAVGRFDRSKAFDVLIRAFAHVPEHRRAEWRLLILGDGPDRPACLQLAEDLGVSASVSMPGVSDDVPAALADADLFVLSSRYEGFPNVLIEAMAAGLPVVTTEFPTFDPSQIDRDVDVLVVPVEDTSALTGAIDHLINDPGTRSDLGRAAASAAERFKLDSVGARWDALLGESTHA